MTCICLLTGSLAPSGTGAYMIASAEGLAADEVIVAGGHGSGLLERAAATGFGVKARDDESGLARWFRRASPTSSMFMRASAGKGMVRFARRRRTACR